MSLVLHGHPFSSYTQKVLIALYENGTPFEFRVLDGPPAFEELGALWPLRQFPVLADNGATVIEASIVVEYLMLHYPGRVRFLPTDADAALKVRFLDRFFDNYVMTPMQKMVFDRIRQENERDAKGVADAKVRLDASYAWLENTLKDRQWAAGDAFTLADCAAAPSLFYADWTHRIGPQFPNVRAYRARLLARPSFARAVDEARPFRPFFPLGAPDRD